jgi:uncharacterized protein YjbI with pentapeptide repeats
LEQRFMAEDIPPPHTPDPPVRDASLKTPEALVWGAFLGIAAVGLVTLAASGAEIWTRDYWGGNRSEILRNIGLLVLAVPALWLAWRRTNTASRQADIANENKETANRQQRVAERGMNVERYQKGAQMLESDELSVRIAGIYGLRELAISDPEESYIIVQSLLFAFIREKSKTRKIKQPEAEDETEGTATEPATFEDLSPDVQEALAAAIALRQAIPNARHLEAEAQWSPNLARANLFSAILDGANLSDANLKHANLSNAKLARASLSKADLDFANLSNANLDFANLSGAKLSKANLSNAYLADANLSGAYLSKADLSGAYLSEADLSCANLNGANLSTADLEDVLVDERTDLTGIWARKDRPPRNMPPEIAAAITYRDPAERKDDD